MMTTSDKYTTSDLVQAIVDQRPLDAEKAFNARLGDKLADLVAARKVEIGKTMFQPKAEKPAEPEAPAAETEKEETEGADA